MHVTDYQVKPWIKTSLGPGSGVVTKYLLQRYKMTFGFHLFILNWSFGIILLVLKCFNLYLVLVSVVACKSTWTSRAFTLLAMAAQHALEILGTLMNQLLLLLLQKMYNFHAFIFQCEDRYGVIKNCLSKSFWQFFGLEYIFHINCERYLLWGNLAYFFSMWFMSPFTDIVAAAVLSGNRNFEGRVHPLTRANYLASPPLVVAYALAGTVCTHILSYIFA